MAAAKEEILEGLTSLSDIWDNGSNQKIIQEFDEEEISTCGWVEKNSERLSSTHSENAKSLDCHYSSRCDEPLGNRLKSDDSEDEIYFSASEDIPNALPDSFKVSDPQHDAAFTEWYASKDAKCIHGNRDSISSYTSTCSSDSTDSQLIGRVPCHGTRKKSKRQKRKQKERNKVASFLNACSGLEFDFGSVHETIKWMDEVDRQIPSLFGICLDSLKRSGKMQLIPPAIMKLQQKSTEKLVLKTQSKVVERFLLDHEEEDLLNKCQLRRYWFQNCFANNKKKYQHISSLESSFVLPTKNVWNTNIFHKGVTTQYFPGVQSYNGTDGSSFLLFSYISYAKYFNFYESSSWKSSIQSSLVDPLIKALQYQSALAAIVEQKLPVQFPSSCFKKRSKNLHQQSEEAVENYIDAIKHSLSKKYPKGVNVCFDNAVPFALWAKGMVSHAEHFVLKFADRPGFEVQQKAMMMSEMARMLCLSAQTERAMVFHRMAADIVLHSGISLKAQDEVMTQMLMLMASCCDSGVLSLAKKRQSISLWQAALRSHYTVNLCLEELTTHIADAMLCFHSGFDTDENMASSVDVLSDLTKENKMLLYHLSFLHALAGDSKKSCEVFWKYCQQMVNQNNPTLGYDPIEIAFKGKSFNPWDSFSVCEGSSFQPVKWLAVEWRTQIPFLSLSSKRVGTEADISSKGLNLRLTEEGYITGDIGMFLPPVKNVCLNPFTGSLVFSNNPKKTQAWKCMINPVSDQIFLPAILPMPMCYELYNEVGKTVNLMLGQKSVAFENDTKVHGDILTMIYTDSGGTYEFDVIQAVKDFLYKKVKQNIKKEYDKQQEYAQEHEAYELLDTCYKNNLAMDLNWIFMTVRHNKQQKEMLKKKAEQEVKTIMQKNSYLKNDKLKYWTKIDKINSTETSTGVAKTNSVSKIHQEKFSLYLLQKQEIWDNRLFLYTDTSGTRTRNRMCLVFDLESSNKFMKPDFKDFCSAGNNIVSPDNGIAVHSQGFYGMTSLGNQFKVTYRNGNEIKLTLGHQPANIPLYSPKALAIGDHLLAPTNDNQLLVVCPLELNHGFCQLNDLIVKDIHKLGPGLLLVHVDSGLVFTSWPMCKDNHSLRPCKISTDNLNRGKEVSLADNGSRVNGNFWTVKVIGCKEEMFQDQLYRRVAIAVNKKLFIILAPAEIREDSTILMLDVLSLPGEATEAMFINRQVGFVVTWTHHKDKKSIFYREHLFHFDYLGNLVGVLPFLGYGPRSFLSVYLEDDEEVQKKYPGHGNRGWYLYMRDGHEGIICIRLC